MRIILDPHKIYQLGKNTLSVNSDLTYVRSRKAILNYFTTGNREYENIYVAEHPYDKWFNDLPDHVQIISPKSLLIDKYPTIDLPFGLSDGDIMQLGLLDAGIEPTAKAILKHFLNVIIPTRIDISQLLQTIYQLAESVLINKRAWTQSFLTVIWKRTLIDALMNLNDETKILFKPIIELDEVYCTVLTKGLYGIRNDFFRKYWLEDSILEFHKRDIPVSSIEKIISNSSLTLATSERNELSLVRFYEEHLRSGAITISELSGYYSAELTGLLLVATKIDKSEYEKLVEKFENILDDKQRFGLSKLVIPELVACPIDAVLDVKEQAKRLKKWSVESFIPYKFFYDKSKTPDPDALAMIEKNAALFGDWLFNNLEAILNEDEIYTNIDVVKNIRTLIKDQSIIVWLVIDGFAAHYTSSLEMILKDHGINRIQTNWSFATLPTITQVAIPVTVSGKFASAINDDDFFNRKELLKKAFPDKRTIYSSQPSEFSSTLNNKTFDVCCLHVHDIDKEMHKNETDFYHGRLADIEHHLQRYIEVVSNFIKKNPDRRIKLLISTDHGATKCLTNAQMIKSPKLEELALSRPYERCIPLTEAVADQNWERNDFYVLKKEVSRNKYDWAIARGYKYFGKNDSGYRHGGLTPEEVVVPVITGQILQVDAIKLVVRPIGLLEFRFGKTERNFKFRIRNTDINHILITDVTIIEEKDALFELPLHLQANAESDLLGTIKLHQRLKTQAKNGILRLNLGVKYNSLGILYEDVLPIDVLTEKDEFETDFL